jgi:FAD:protein FMN transferase
VSVKAESASLAAFMANVWLILPENDKSLLADQILNIEIFEAEYLADDIRTKLTLNYDQDEDE